MQYISSLMQYISFSPSLFSSLILAGITFYLARFYIGVFYNYPPGPLPLPIIGNILLFRNHKLPWNMELFKLYKKYGPIITVWIGPFPFIFVGELELLKEAFNKGELCNRQHTDMSDVFNNKHHRSIIMNDYGNIWQTLRNVAHTTIRKYSKTDELAHLVYKSVVNNVKLIKQNEQTDIPFAPQDYIFNIFANIIGSAVFSQSFNIGDEKLADLHYVTTDFQIELGSKIGLWDFVPILRLFMKDPIEKYRNIYGKQFNWIKSVYEDHEETYGKTSRHDFCDILIKSKLEAIAKEKESANYLTDNNIVASLIDLILAGIETTQTTFTWMVLFIAYYPHHQKRLRDEIQTVIGDRKPTIKDREQLHFVMAFISEILRYRNATPFGLLHEAVVNCNISNYNIPKGTLIAGHQYYILMDEKHWDNPDQFNPDRYLDDNKMSLSTKPGAFIPFGVGRRICPGELMANADLFLALVIFLQQTDKYMISLENINKDRKILDASINFPFSQPPQPFRIIFKDKNTGS